MLFVYVVYYIYICVHLVIMSLQDAYMFADRTSMRSAKLHFGPICRPLRKRALVGAEGDWLTGARGLTFSHALGPLDVQLTVPQYLVPILP